MPGLFGERTGGRLALLAASSRLALAFSLVLSCAGPMCAPVSAAQPELVRLGGTNGTIVTSARIGKTLYVGGYFTKAGPVSGASVLLDPDTGNLHSAWPGFTGEVNAAVADGRGGWFLGGSMTTVDGEPHGGLAHVDSRGSVRAWDPRPDGTILALAVQGDTLFAGGWFTHVSGAPRRHLAAFRIRSGELLEVLPEPNREVRALLVDGGRLYVGGSQDSLGGSLRGPVAAIDIDGWRLSNWVPVVPGLPQPGVFGTTQALARSGTHLLVGGAFYPEHGLLAFSTDTGEIASWVPQVTGPFDQYLGGPQVLALAVRDSNLFIGGRFSTVGGHRRGGLARVGIPSGVVSSWDPRPGPWYGDFSSYVNALVARGKALFMGGGFELVSDSSRSYIAAVDAETGALLPWATGMERGVLALAADEDRLLAGGYFIGAGSQWKEWRDDLAAFDLTTGALLPWSPTLSGFGVEALAAVGGQIIVGGYFDALGGRARYCLGAVDTLSGAPADWNPAGDGPVLELKAVGDTLYVGGAFTTFMGQSRANVARFDMATRSLTPWAPMANDHVASIEPAGDRVFLAGGFRAINGIERRYLAAVDIESGVLDSFDGQLDGGVAALAACGDTLYVGGLFRGPNGLPYSPVAALDARTGNPLFWVPTSSHYATGLVKLDSVLYVGGLFEEIGGVRRKALAAVSARSGAILPLDAQLEWPLWGLSEHGGTLFMLGRFRSAFGTPTAGLLGIPLAPPLPPSPRPQVDLSLSDLWPNPAPGSSVLAEFATPTSGELSIELFDIQGRRVSVPVRRRPVPPGRYRLEIPTRHLGEGVYLCRVELSGRALTKKLLVLR